MTQIPWSRIREAFDGEWVELTRFSWKQESLHPQSGVIRHHSANRRELLKMIARSGRVDGAVIIFVGYTPPTAFAERGLGTHNNDPL